MPQMQELYNEILASFADNTIFLFCAYAGLGIWIIQFLLSLAGTGETDFEGEELGDDRNFKWFSFKAIAGFLMMFGLTALTCLRDFNLNIEISTFIAFIVGLFAIYILNLIYKLSKRMHSSGSVFQINDLVGKEAYVYQRISADGVGKISLSHHDLTHEIEAVSDLKQEIASFTRVRILRILDGNVVAVTPL